VITEPKSKENAAADDDPITRLQRAAGTAISAAAVKAKFLVEQEEGYIRQLAALVIEKQVLHAPFKVSDSNAPFIFYTCCLFQGFSVRIASSGPTMTCCVVQFQKMETKMSFLTEVGNLVLRSRDLTERMRKKLLLERSMIIASRMGAAAASRTIQHGAPVTTRLPVGHVHALNPQLRRP
jgi:SWI/SNF related-matrix-associated actin-dependent regulator of chromatin subfamily C